ncbi:NAD(P)H-hydrate dehydratase [bacterium]|nr:NAD(P)H-hydrate dehydratase [bacterium]
MKVVTAQQMAQIDEYAIKKLGIPSAHLMETAGIKVAEYVHAFLQKIPSNKKSIVLFAWKGNNGGDAIVAAHCLLDKDPTIDLKLIYLAPIDKLQGDALFHYSRLLEKYPSSIIHADTPEQLKETERYVQSANVIIDGIFGTGFLGEPIGQPAEAIKFINSCRKPIIAWDIPSGVNGTTGKASLAVKAQITLTIGLPKYGLLFADGPEYTGKIQVIDIGFPTEAINSVESNLHYLTKRWIKGLLPERQENSHKNTFGHLFIIGGSSGLTGSVILAAQAALRSGCGMVTVCCPESVNSVIESGFTEAITCSLPETDKKTIHHLALGQLFPVMKDRRCSAVLIGPGLGKHPQTTKFVIDFIQKCPYPLAIDADALNALAMVNTNLLNKTASPTVITPHPGEFSRLIHKDTDDIQSHRLSYAEYFTKNHNTTLILKGKNTLITAKNSPRFINPTGNNGLATAGSGDVLAGMLGAFLALGLPSIKAACCATFYHGMAGEFAAKTFGTRSMIASDIVHSLHHAFRA